MSAIVGDRLVDRDRGAVDGLEVLAELFRRREVRHRQFPRLGLQRLDAVTEEGPYVLLAPPQRRRLGAGRRRRRVRLHGREHLTDEPGRCPGDQADGAAGPADPDEFVGRRLMVRCEHHPDAGQHGVELRVRIGQGFGVPGLPGQLHPGFGGQSLPGRQQFGRQVGGCDLGAGLRRWDGDVPRSGRDVEHPVARADPSRRHQGRTQFGDHVGHHGRIVAERPHGGVPLLQRAVLLAQVGGLVGLCGHAEAPPRWLIE